MAQGGDWLSRTLRDLRTAAGLSQTAAAVAAGLDQGTTPGAAQVRLARIETGRFVPTEDEVKRLATAYHAPAAVRRTLLKVARDLRGEVMSSRVILRRPAQVQARYAAIEEASDAIRVWQPLIIPGLLQTEGYARAVFSDRLEGAETERAVAARTSRAAVLDSTREFTFVLAEGALHWSAGTAVMAEQLGHLADLASRYRIGIVPRSQAVTTFPTHGFALFDERLVIAGLRHATAFIADPPDVAEYVRWFAKLAGLAVFGAHAQRVIERVGAEYARVGQG